MLFNIFKCYLFSPKNDTDFASYVDNNTLDNNITCDGIEDIITLLGNDSIKLFKLFADKQMNTNKGKCLLHITAVKISLLMLTTV